MSRIGRKPISVPSGVKVTIEGRTVTVTGPKGTLSRALPGVIAIVAEGDTLQLSRPSDSKTNRSMHGLCRTLVANMVEGVSQLATARSWRSTASATVPRRLAAS